jgi:hypothetical protein
MTISVFLGDLSDCEVCAVNAIIRSGSRENERWRGIRAFGGQAMSRKSVRRAG